MDSVQDPEVDVGGPACVGLVVDRLGAAYLQAVPARGKLLEVDVLDVVDPAGADGQFVLLAALVDQSSASS